MRVRSRSLACGRSVWVCRPGTLYTYCSGGQTHTGRRSASGSRYNIRQQKNLYGNSSHVVSPLQSRVDALRLVPRPQGWGHWCASRRGPEQAELSE